METFLTEKSGITSTSANHLANIAKELINNYEFKLNEVSFDTKTIELISGSSNKVLQKEIEDLSVISEYITKIAELKTFCAWVREAIKYKESQLSRIKRLTISEYLRINNLPEKPVPIRGKDTTNEDIIAEMSIAERQKYLQLEAFAATFGQYIHPGGRISDARYEHLKHQTNPTEVSGEGQNLVISRYESNISEKDIEDTYLKLQDAYRGYEKDLNYIKSKIKEEINKRDLAVEQKYSDELLDFNNWRDKIVSEMHAYCIMERDRISSLKIRIPNELQETYEYLNSVGK